MVDLKMKKFNYIFSLIVLVLTSCGEDPNQLVTGYGTVNISLNIDGTIKSMRAGKSIEVATPDVNDFVISATGLNGNNRTWANLSEFESSHKHIPVDKYTFLAEQGNILDEGFNTITFAGATDAIVYDSQTTDVVIDCRLAGTLFSQDCSLTGDLLSDAELRIKSEKGKYIQFTSGDTRNAFVRPGKTKVELIVTNNDGKEAALQAFTINTQAAEYYPIEISEHNGKMHITYADGVAAKVIPVDKALFETEAPQFTAGISATSIVAGNASPSIPCQIKADGGIEYLWVNVVSKTDNEWSNEIDMAEEFGVKGSTTATIDFERIATALSEGKVPGTYTLIAQVEDKYGRVAVEPLTLSIQILAPDLTIVQPASIDMDTHEATINIDYNGKNFEEDITIQYATMLKQWEDLDIKNIRRNGNRYTITIEPPYDIQKVYLRAKYGDVISEEVTLEREMPEFNIRFGEENIWTSKADLYIEAERSESLTRFLRVIIKEKNGEWYPAVVERVTSDSRLTLSTLMPATAYSISVTANGEDFKTFDFVTESALELPNSDFEDNHTEVISINSINCGGKYSNISSWTPTYNTSSIHVKECAHWRTVNAKTCSKYAKTANTWFMVPTTEIVNDAYSGNFALKIRNAAWDINGIEPARDTRTDKEYYSRNVPYIANRSAGKAFLGNYVFDATGKESYDEGIDFTSRPTGVSAYYKYRRDLHDAEETGMITVQVLGKTDTGYIVIGTGKGLLNPSTSYTYFSMPVEYTIRDVKAVKLRLMISSSNHASHNQADETAHIKTTDYLQQGVSTGAELTIDKVELLYH